MPDPDRPIRFDDRAEFRAWAERQPGRWEREDGRAVAMAPERLVHTRIKAQAWRALTEAIGRAGLPCEAFADGATVEVDERTDFEPDALVTCGPRDGDRSTAVAAPVVVVEVLSPSTGYRDISVKLDGYFRVPSVHHYLLLSTDGQRVVHHRRDAEGGIATRIHAGGVIELVPPGLTLAVAELYRGTELA